MQVLTSPRNPLLKEVRKALARGGLTGHGFCIAEGFHLLEEALRSGCEIATVLVSETAQREVPVEDPTVLPDDLFRSLSTTETSQGVIALVRPPGWTLEQLFRGQSLVVVIDAVQDPGNCGTILRSAEAFGATGVAMLKGSVNPYNPKCVRASAGSVFRVPLVAALHEAQWMAAVDEHRIEMYALASGGALDIAGCRFDRSCALVVGSEGQGVSEGLRAKSTRVRIPTIAVESLNAATAAGIALYEARRQRMAKS